MKQIICENLNKHVLTARNFVLFTTLTLASCGSPKKPTSSVLENKSKQSGTASAISKVENVSAEEEKATGGQLNVEVKDTRPLDPSALQSLKCDSSKPDRLAFRPLRLTNFQLKSSLFQIFGNTTSTNEYATIMSTFPTDFEKGKFDSRLRATEAQRFSALMNLSKHLGGQVTTNATVRQQLASLYKVNCTFSPSANWSVCGENLVKAMMLSMQRFPPTQEMLDGKKRVYEAAIANKATPEVAWQGVFAGLFLSPAFLHSLSTVGTNGKLNSWAVGTRLSLALTGQIPDAELLELMKSNQILSPETRKTYALKVLASQPSAQANFAHFSNQLFQVYSSPVAVNGTGLSNITEQVLRDAYLKDFGASSVHPVFSGKGSFQDYLSSTKVMATHKIVADAYGVQVSDSVQDVPSAKRHSLFTRVGFLTTLNGARNLPHRGVFVLDKMLCSPMGQPPANAAAIAGSISTDNLSHRKSWDAVTSGTTCIGCHIQINPAGAIFDEYDGWGRFSSTQTITAKSGAKTVAPWDTTASLTLRDGSKLAVAGPTELSAALSSSALAQACFAVNWIDYAFAFENKNNCMLKSAFDAVASQSEKSLQEMMVDIVSSPEFVEI